MPEKTEKVFQTACTLVSFQPANGSLKAQSITKKQPALPSPSVYPFCKSYR
ncbi:hypothetical protein HMPREF9098_2029 [Kingella denitrificans ATCC 33394]|uniref:Uncharacterized protein n=1 Tax=Kingella denitrificans ATCC 33394 TaxID=888741 RepID=F0F1P4_9NEIS|nr:hypothetical protein HMPREF9098_2029 [Kingella denitrificans ATCC 33394]